MKKFLRLLLTLFTAFGLLLLAAGGLLFYFQDTIIRNFVSEANKGLNTKVSIGKIDLNYFNSFPQVGILLKGVHITESIPGSEKKLLEADQLVLAFDTWQLLRGEYELHHLILKNATVHMRFDGKGRSNFDVFNSVDDAGKSVSFQLRAVRLLNVNYTYDPGNKRDYYNGNFQDVKARFQWKDRIAKTDLRGSVRVIDITVDNTNYVSNRNTFIGTEFYWDHKRNVLDFKQSALEVGSSQFEVKGNFTFGSHPDIDLTVSEKKSNLTDILLFVPEKFAAPVYPYQIKGNWQYTLTLKGPMGKSNPAIDMVFSVKDGTFYQPDIKQEIHISSMDGSYSNGPLRNLGTSSVVIPSFVANLKNGNLTGNFQLSDFNNPSLKAELKGKLPLQELIDLFGATQLTDAGGNLSINLTANGLWKDVFSKSSGIISGDVAMQDVSFSLKDGSTRLEQVNGDLIFNNRDVALSNVSGFVAGSDFRMNGIVKDVLAERGKDERWTLKARLDSRFIDLDALLTDAGGDNPEFSWPQDMVLSLDCQVEELKYRKWNLRALSGRFGFNPKMAAFHNMAADIAQGRVSISGLVEKKDGFVADWQISLKEVLIDSLFYLSDNFSQTFISAHNLSGFLDGQLDLRFGFDKTLKIDLASIVADADLTIRQGQLRNFEPMQSLSRFAKEEELAFIRFSELKNKVHIENERVYIPEMVIRSSVRELAVIGVHNFDQRFEYKVKLPVFKKGKIPDEAADAVEDDGKGGLFIYLIIAGTPDNFKVSYDKLALRGKIRDGWKKEKEELKKAFTDKKTDKKEEKKVEVNEEEFFDFD